MARDRALKGRAAAAAARSFLFFFLCFLSTGGAAPCAAAVMGMVADISSACTALLLAHRQLFTTYCLTKSRQHSVEGKVDAQAL